MKRDLDVNAVWDAEARRVDERYDLRLDLGDFLLQKFRQQCGDAGVEHAARNARKQGVPLQMVLRMMRLSG